LIHDKRNVEDVGSEGEDHCYDSIRYGLMSRPWAGTEPKGKVRDKYRDKRERAKGGEGGWMTA